MDKTFSLYDRLIYKTNRSGGARNWVGNLRWYVSEKNKGCFSFCCISALSCMSHEEHIKKGMKKTLFTICTDQEKTEEWTYGADYIKTNLMSVYLPFYEYAGYVEIKSKIDIKYSGIAYEKDGFLIIRNDNYYICFDTNWFSIDNKKQSIEIQSDSDQKWLTVTYHIDENQAKLNCQRLSSCRQKTIVENKEFWNSYLESCPVTELPGGFSYKKESLNIDEHFSNEEIITRQLWHYCCMLVNVSDVEFNECQIYMAPDKDNWIGTWSNDGPQCMAALSLTNQKDLAKRIIVSYLKNAMNNNGELSWYMHADGVGCYGQKGDVGRFSHGDPYMPHVVEYYIRNTGDESILSEDVGGISVYKKLKKYVLNLHNLRDINNDSLIEWANLWETGWDDKGGTFFTSACLAEWMDIVSNGTDDEIALFYRKHQHPVIAVSVSLFMRAISSIAFNDHIVMTCSTTAITGC